MIEIIESDSAFEALGAEWRGLQQDAGVRVFQTYEWCWYGWLLTKSVDTSARLWILKWVREGCPDEVILPAYIDGCGQLRFINDLHSDVCDAVYRSDGLNRHYAYKEMTDAILCDKRIRGIAFHKMIGGSEALNYFGVLLRGAFVYRDNSYSWVTTPRTDAFISEQVQLKQKDRSRLKGIVRKGAGFDFKIYAKNKGDVYPVDRIRNLRDFMAQGIRGGMSFLSDGMIEFMGNLYNCGMCEIPVLESADGVQILAYRMIKGTRVNCWVVLYRNARMTTELYVRYMSEKAKESQWVFDFGVGAYGYKLGTFRPELGVTMSVAYGKGIWRQMLVGLRVNLRFVKDYIKSLREGDK